MLRKEDVHALRRALDVDIECSEDNGEAENGMKEVGG